MNALQVVQRLHEHRARVNRLLLDAAAGLSDEQQRTPFPIGQGSIWKTLLHLYGAEYVWLEALEGNQTPVTPGDLPHLLPGNQQGRDALESLDQLTMAWRELTDRWNNYLQSLDPKALDDLVTKVGSSGKTSTTRRSDILLHVCTHAHYTVAQAINMLRQLGVERLPDPMLITMAREQAADAAL